MNGGSKLKFDSPKELSLMQYPKDVVMKDHCCAEEDSSEEIIEPEIPKPKKWKSPEKSIFEQLHLKRIKVSEEDSVPFDLDLES